MSEPLARARALMALALSTTSQEEARTTAVIALRLIDKHKLLEKPEPRLQHRTVAVDFWEGLTRAARPQPQPQPRPWSPAEHKRPEVPTGYSWMHVRVGAARCLHCGEVVPQGSRAMHWNHHGFIHETCWPLAEPTL